VGDETRERSDQFGGFGIGHALVMPPQSSRLERLGAADHFDHSVSPRGSLNRERVERCSRVFSLSTTSAASAAKQRGGRAAAKPSPWLARLRPSAFARSARKRCALRHVYTGEREINGRERSDRTA
jgi:hypothetical protein